MPLRVGMVADGPQARAGSGSGPTSQVPTLRPARRTWIPAGVHPPVVELRCLLFAIAVDELALAFLGWSRMPGKKPPLHELSIGGGSLPPGRGRLCAIIQRRQTFCARIQSPFQNCSTISGVRTSSPGLELEVGQLLAGADAQRRRPASRANCAAHWPGQPTTTITPSPRPLEVEVGQAAVGGPPAGGREALLGLRLQRRSRAARSSSAVQSSPRVMVQHELALAPRVAGAGPAPGCPPGSACRPCPCS